MKIDKMCKECGGECCRWLTVPLNLPIGVLNKATWFSVRGKLNPVSAAITEWNVPSICPKLDKAGRCTCYASRPQTCCDYVVDGPDCRKVRGVAT